MKLSPCICLINLLILAVITHWFKQFGLVCPRFRVLSRQCHVVSLHNVLLLSTPMGLNLWEQGCLKIGRRSPLRWRHTISSLVSDFLNLRNDRIGLDLCVTGLGHGRLRILWLWKLHIVELILLRWRRIIVDWVHFALWWIPLTSIRAYRHRIDCSSVIGSGLSRPSCQSLARWVAFISINCLVEVNSHMLVDWLLRPGEYAVIRVVRAGSHPGLGLLVGARWKLIFLRL